MSISKANFSFKKLGFIGGGNISQAILEGFAKFKNFDPKTITISEPNPETRKILSKKFGVSAIYDNQKILESNRYTIIAVKPSVFRNNTQDFIHKNGNYHQPNIISVMAGVKYEELATTFKTDNIFRCMPNTSAKINKSVTFWYTKSTNKSSVNNVSQIFSQLGFEQMVTDENIIDKATAITGSGPAYVYTMMESMIDAGILIGLNREITTQMVLNTFEGSSLMAQNSGFQINTLKQQITSPGGTTAQALYQLDKCGFKHSINEAILAAYSHSKN